MKLIIADIPAWAINWNYDRSLKSVLNQLLQSDSSSALTTSTSISSSYFIFSCNCDFFYCFSLYCTTFSSSSSSSTVFLSYLIFSFNSYFFCSFFNSCFYFYNISSSYFFNFFFLISDDCTSMSISLTLARVATRNAVHIFPCLMPIHFCMHSILLSYIVLYYNNGIKRSVKDD